MKLLAYYCWVGIGVGLLVVPQLLLAQGLVPCGGDGQPSCQLCYGLTLVENITTWLVGILFIIATIFFVVSGYQLVTSGGDAGRKESAKKRIANTAVGFMIVLAGWFIIDVVMRVFLSEQPVGGWDQLQCVAQPELTANPREFSLSIQASGFDFVSAAPERCSPAPAGNVNCAPQIASCTNDGGTAAVDRSNPNSHNVICEYPVGVADPGTTELVCDVGPSGDRVLCAAQQQICRDSGGTPQVDSSDPARYVVQCTPNSPTEACRTSEMTNINLFGFNTTVHNSIVGRLRAVDQEWRSRGGNSAYRVYSVGGYSCRRVTGGSRYSVHAYGLAVDINPAENPYVRTSARPCPSNMPGWFVGSFTSRGFGWGGNWRSVCDAMHFSDASFEGGSQRIR